VPHYHIYRDDSLAFLAPCRLSLGSPSSAAKMGPQPPIEPGQHRQSAALHDDEGLGLTRAQRVGASRGTSAGDDQIADASSEPRPI